ncbi:MAG TPA: carboxypeptidase-like regulatory domain-containing protein, partial [Paludibacteraceae bacterium]|nr:carboxypeptidase-like regulatory domain-containing protein [Paludibacteraceae bacterium]
MKNTKVKLLLMISALLFVGFANAKSNKSVTFPYSAKTELGTENAQQIPDQQKVKVSGQVKDVSGEPVIGVSVVEQGTANGTATDINGNYSLNVSGNGKLTFTYVGFVSQTISVEGKSLINLTMSEDTKTLDELVVIGYGIVKKSDLTG